MVGSLPTKTLEPASAAAAKPLARPVLIDRANLMLDAYDDQFASADEVRVWAESELAVAPGGASVPAWLLDLLRDGPEHFSDASHSWRKRAGFKVRFALHATRVNLVDRASVERFARWLAGAAMGEDLGAPEVILGYEVDHYLCDHEDVNLALQPIHESLPPLLPTCRAALATILG